MEPTSSQKHIPPVFIDSTPEVRPAVNENWEARRELAAALRSLNNAVLSSDVPTKQLKSLTAIVQAEVANVEANKRLLGLRAQGDCIAEREGQYPDMYYEVSPAIGQSNANAPPMHIWREDDCMHASVTANWGYEGPSGQLHGGIIALLFDQLLGITQRTTGTMGLTGSLLIKYHHPTPLNEELRLTARLDRVEGRKKFLVSELWYGGNCTASCEAVFIERKN